MNIDVPTPDVAFRRYQELQRYAGFGEAEVQRVQTAADMIEPHLDELIDDFYRELTRHPATLKVITGGKPQIERLKGTLRSWIRELLSGTFDEEYVARRLRVGLRHREIGLDQEYVIAAMARLRSKMNAALPRHFKGNVWELVAIVRAVDLALDLDLTIIDHAYRLGSKPSA